MKKDKQWRVDLPVSIDTVCIQSYFGGGNCGNCGIEVVFRIINGMLSDRYWIGDLAFMMLRVAENDREMVAYALADSRLAQDVGPQRQEGAEGTKESATSAKPKMQTESGQAIRTDGKVFLAIWPFGARRVGWGGGGHALRVAENERE